MDRARSGGVRGRGGGDVEIDDAGLDDRKALGGSSLRMRLRRFSAMTMPPARGASRRKGCAAAARHKGEAPGMAEADDGDDFVRGFGVTTASGGAKGGETVAFIGGQVLGPLQHSARRQQGREAFEHGRGHGARLAQDFLQRRQEEVDVADGGAVAHEADAPGFAGHDAEAGADFDAVVFESRLRIAASSAPLGMLNAIQRVERAPGNVSDAHRLEAGPQALVHCAWRAMRFRAPPRARCRAPRAAHSHIHRRV